MPDVIHMGVPGSIESPWESAAGGIGRNEEDAQLAAIGEAVERYAAAIAQIPIRPRNSIPESSRIDATEWHLFTNEQRNSPAFPFPAIYAEDCPFTNAFDFQTNNEIWVAHPFVALRDDYQTGIPTSSGLAAGPTANHALLRAIQELIERDALMMTWLHSVPGRAIRPPQKYTEAVDRLGGEMHVFELTPIYSPFPVIAIAGGIQKRGKWRYSLGVACRETWEDALEKAFLEWNQGVLFAGIYENYVDTTEKLDPMKLKSFDEHAIYYTLQPDQWHNLPLFKNQDALHDIAIRGKKMSMEQSLKSAKYAFKTHNIRMYYRDLTTIDADQMGVRVVRATSPDLAPIFAHQEWPLLGNLSDKLHSRYPWAPQKLVFPNVMPHPLG